MYQLNIGFILYGQVRILVCESLIMPDWSFVLDVAQNEYNAGLLLGYSGDDIIGMVMVSLTKRIGIRVYETSSDVPCAAILGASFLAGRS